MPKQQAREALERLGRSEHDEYVTTQAAAAERLGVSRSTLASDWVPRPGFPPKEPDGWNVTKIEEWAEENKLGKHQQRAQTNGNADGEKRITLTEANILKVLEQTENERIRKERQLVEQQVELGSLLLAEHVVTFHQQLAATIVQSLEGIGDAVDRALPHSMDEEDRDRVLEDTERAIKLAMSAAQQFVEGK